MKSKPEGFALLATMVALAGIGAIVVIGFALAQNENRTGLEAVARVQAQAAAETAAADALLGWDTTKTPHLVGEEQRIVALHLPGATEGTATVRAMGGPVYAIRATGVRRESSGDAIGTAELEVLVLLDSAEAGRIRPRLYPRGWRILP
jgi:hypothetical protein